MSQEILYIKLCQLDDEWSKLHSRIQLSETAGEEQLHKELETLKRECAETEMALEQQLRLSKSSLVSILWDGYEKIEPVIRDTQARLKAFADEQPEEYALAEAKLLLAEYALDFASQAAARALLISLEAIDTQLLLDKQQEGSKI